MIVQLQRMSDGKRRITSISDPTIAAIGTRASCKALITPTCA